MDDENTKTDNEILLKTDDIDILLKIERLNSSIYRKIIEANTNIIIPDDNNEDIIEQFNILQKLLKLEVVEKTQEIEDNKKILYKAFTNIQLVNEPSIDEQNNKISEVDKYINETDGLTLSDANKIFEECFRDIEKSKVYSKILERIRNTRLQINGINTDEYSLLIKEHIDRLTKLFQDKGLSDKIVMKNIATSLSSLEIRLVLYYPLYINTELIIDELTKYKKCIIYTLNFPKKYVPFNYDEIFKTFFNHGTLLCTLRECIERNFDNIYGYNNIVYIQMPKSTDNDPFSFYHLKKIENKKRYWNMDCRLEDLSNKFIDNVRPYLLDMFRKIYFDVFSDNDYRHNFLSKMSKVELDVKQIIQNICLLCNPKKFNKFLRNIIKDKATYKVTTNDIKNLSADDSSQRRRYENDRENIDPVESMKLLFDNISSEDAVDYYRSVNVFL